MGGKAIGFWLLAFGWVCGLIMGMVVDYGVGIGVGVGWVCGLIRGWLLITALALANPEGMILLWKKRI